MNITNEIRKQVTKAKGFPTGTVVRFDRAYGNRTLTYAAIAITGGEWYITGTYNYENSFTNSEFMELLARDEVSNIATATGWDTI